MADRWADVKRRTGAASAKTATRSARILVMLRPRAPMAVCGIRYSRKARAVRSRGRSRPATGRHRGCAGSAEKDDWGELVRSIQTRLACVTPLPSSQRRLLYRSCSQRALAVGGHALTVGPARHRRFAARRASRMISARSSYQREEHIPSSYSSSGGWRAAPRAPQRPSPNRQRTAVPANRGRGPGVTARRQAAEPEKPIESRVGLAALFSALSLRAPVAAVSKRRRESPKTWGWADDLGADGRYNRSDRRTTSAASGNETTWRSSPRPRRGPRIPRSMRRRSVGLRGRSDAE